MTVDNLEAHMIARLAPRKRAIEDAVAQYLARDTALTNRAKFLLGEILDNGRRGLFSEAEIALDQLDLPENRWSPSAAVTDAEVAGIDRTVLQHRLDELRDATPQYPPVFGDFVAWSARQGGLLRRIALGEPLGNEEVDWGNVIEEIESLGRSQRNELASRVRTVLEHLLRLEASPATQPGAGWRTTIVRSRQDIAKLLEDNPSLRPQVEGVITAELPRAREIAAAALEEYDEQPRVPLDQLHYTKEQVLGSWLPKAA